MINITGTVQYLVSGLLLALIIGGFTTIIMLLKTNALQKNINKQIEKNMEKTNLNQDKTSEILNELVTRVAILEHNQNKEV